jgi:lysyl-tRNA synthetase class 2
MARDLRSEMTTKVAGAGRPWAQRVVESVPTVLFWYLRVSGVLSVLAWLSYGLIEWMFNVWMLRSINYFGWYPSLPYGLLLILVSVGVRRRKKAAWRISVVLFLLFFAVWALAGLSDWGGWGELITAAAFGLVVALLVAARMEFYALPDRANRRLALVVFSVLLVVGGVIGTTLVFLTDRDPRGPAWTHLVYAGLQTLLGAGDNGWDLNVNVPIWVDGILGILGSGLLVITVWALFRPGQRLAVLTPDEELPARALLAEWGDRDSLGYFALRRDKDVILSPNGRAAIAYRVEGSVSLASGDPLGDPEAWDAAISAWLAECRAHAWIPGVLGASERAAAAFGRCGLDALELGDEAILDLRDFNLDGRDMRQVRQAVRRVERAGYTVRIRRHGAIGREDMSELIADADRWRDGHTERGFSMALGRLGDPTDARCVMVEAFDGAGRRRGLLSFVPWGRPGLSLDLMRRDRDAENGLNEFMVAKLAENATSVGVTRVSLNFAMLRSVFERGSAIGAGPISRLAYRLLSVASKFWQLESLFLANAKYNPVWTPRFMCFPQSRDLVRIGLAAARAEGFLPTLFSPRLDTPSPSPTLVEKIKRIEESADAARMPARRLSEQERVRHDKLERLREAGIEPYPLSFERTTTAAGLRARIAALAPDTRTGETVAVAGRVMLAREHGKLIFVRVRDESGDIQLMLAADSLGADSLRHWKQLVDLGDQVGVRGEVVTSRTGELSVLAASWTLTAKCLHPLPAAYVPGSLNEESRVRQRYVDLIVNDDARRMLRTRGDVVSSLRDVLRERGYLEVETPMLQPVHGGAAARPFTTKMNAYNLDLYLRIAPELYLKRLLVGGVGKVFEINRNFRNEGVSPRHNPEFTMLEAYEPYGDYNTMATLTRDLVVSATRAATGGTVVVRDGVEYDFAEPWQEITVYDAVSEALGEQVTPTTSLRTLQKHADRIGLSHNPEWEQGKLTQELFEALVESTLRFPTFVRDFPATTSPLTRPHRDTPCLAEKWDLIVFGLELGTAYSELIDPIVQRRNLTEQSLLAAGGDSEAMDLDEDFLRALEYGMPPAGGMGMGVDRLVMTLTGRNIRDTIPFPLTRPGS